MKCVLNALLFFAFCSFSVCAQTKKTQVEKITAKSAKQKFVDKGTGFEITYPDSVVAVILKNNEDIKGHVEPFVIEIYKEQDAPIKKDGKPVFVTMNAIADDCYQFDEMCVSKHKVDMKEFMCAEGAAGTIYYSFIYQIEKEHYSFLLKFVHRHCNVCIDEQGESKPFNKNEDTRWIQEIVESAQFVKPRK